MKPSEDSSFQPNRSPSDPQSSNIVPQEQEEEFARSLMEVERSLSAIQERYAQVQRDQKRQQELKNRFDEVRQDAKRHQSQELKAQLEQIKQQLEVLEITLESSLFTWSSLKEPFWQAVRFGGIGIVIGWLLKSCSG
jgi:molecular chaperone GrpE (heat shock protein)